MAPGAASHGERRRAERRQARFEAVELGVPPGCCRVPSLREATVARDDLVARLRSAREMPVVLLAAPGGYGKTTTVALWAEADDRPFAWVDVLPADDDPVRLVQHLAVALQEVEPLRPALVRRLVGPGRSVDADLVPALGGELARRPPFVLVLDDVHRLGSDASRRCLKDLLAWIPEGSQVVLCGRSRHPIDLARHRARDGVLELGAPDLAMSTPTATELLRRHGLGLDDEQAAALAHRTEGWPAGLHLAALALDGVDDAADARDERAALPGPARLIADYLVEEVLGGLPAEVVDFLEGSSTLERMTVPVLDELLETDRSGELLAAVEETGNALLAPLHDGSYRYHQLFADVLRARLRRRNPQRARQLDLRASEVLAAAGDVDGAIRLAVRAGDEGRAADLVLGRVLPLVAEGRAGALAPWLDLLGSDAVARQPGLAIALAWLGLDRADASLVHRALDAADRMGDRGPLADGTPSLAVAMAAVRAMACPDGLNGLLVDAELVRSAGEPPANPWWVVATILAGAAHAMVGDEVRARELLRGSLARATELPAFEAAALAHLALLELEAGDPVEAGRLAARALGLAVTHHLEGMVPVVSVFAIGALVAAARGEVEAANRAAAVANRLLPRLGDLSVRTALFGYVLLARTGRLLGRPAEARTWLDEAERARRRDASATHVVAQLEQLQDELPDVVDLRERLVQPLTAAELRVLAYLPTHLSLQEIADRLVVSRNTVKTHSVAVYRKLGVSSRSDAVEVASRVGYLRATDDVLVIPSG